MEELFGFVTEDLHISLILNCKRLALEYSSKRQSQRLGSSMRILLEEGCTRIFETGKWKSGAPDAQVKDCIVATEEEWQFLKRLSDAS